MELKKILLVDDDPDIRMIATISLAQIGGFDVVEAPSGTDALERLATWTPDVVLLDVMMPEMDGPTTLARIHELGVAPEVPVILLTAKVQQREVDRYIELGAIGVIAKPFDPMTLAEQVRRTVADGRPRVEA